MRWWGLLNPHYSLSGDTRERLLHHVTAFILALSTLKVCESRNLGKVISSSPYSLEYLMSLLNLQRIC
jgi:hypothetical protein